MWKHTKVAAAFFLAMGLGFGLESIRSPVALPTRASVDLHPRAASQRIFEFGGLQGAGGAPLQPSVGIAAILAAEAGALALSAGRAEAALSQLNNEALAIPPTGPPLFTVTLKLPHNGTCLVTTTPLPSPPPLLYVRDPYLCLQSLTSPTPATTPTIRCMLTTTRRNRPP
jgi:hypothetical protein